MSATNIPSIGIAIPNNLSFKSKGAIIADANIGVKFGGCGIILANASTRPNNTK
jgi:hypothetical protein